MGQSRMVQLVLAICLLISFVIIPPARAESSFEAGAGAEALVIPQGISLAGYFQRRIWLTQNPPSNPNATYFQASTGQHDVIRAKATALKINNKKLAVVSLDLVAIFPGVREILAQRLTDLGYQPENIIVVATHTHSGPGGFANFRFWELLAADKFLPHFFSEIIRAAEKAIRIADSQLTPAVANTGGVGLDGLAVSRRSNQPIQTSLTWFRLVSRAGQPIATWVNLPVHSDLLTPANLEISGDIAGEVERKWEQRFGGVAMFFSGASGDIDPHGFTRDFDGLTRLGANFDNMISSVVPFQNAAFVPKEIETFTYSQELAKPYLNLGACVSFLGPFANILPYIPLPAVFAQPAQLVGMKIDKHAYVFIPGEPFQNIGEGIRQAGMKAGFETVTTVGLSNSYLGYIMDADEFNRGGYEACNSFYGPTYGAKILEGSEKLLGIMK